MLAEHAHTQDAGCVYCGRKHGQKWINSKGDEKKVTLTINHTSRHLYASEDLYLTWDPRYMEIVCVSCNRQYERGMKPCPSCLEKGKMTYILDRDQECWPCYYEKHPDEKRTRDESRARFDQAIKDYNARQATKRRAAKVRHPCKHRRISGGPGPTVAPNWSGTVRVADPAVAVPAGSGVMATTARHRRSPGAGGGAVTARSRLAGSAPGPARTARRRTAAP